MEIKKSSKLKVCEKKKKCGVNETGKGSMRVKFYFLLGNSLGVYKDCLDFKSLHDVLPQPLDLGEPIWEPRQMTSKTMKA